MALKNDTKLLANIYTWPEAIENYYILVEVNGEKIVKKKFYEIK